MVYKKYVYKRGRKHGPYYYHSYRDGNSVRKIYIGGRKEYREWERKKEKEIFRGKSLSEKSRTTFQIFPSLGNKWLIIPIVILLIVVGFLIYQVGITGKISLDIQDSYTAGENITGILKLVLKKGELLPINSKLFVNYSGTTYEVPISNFIHAISNGSFYIENTKLSGYGEGYGFSGERITYPAVFFTLKVYDSEKEEIPKTPVEENITEVPETPTEETEQIPTEENVTEVIEIPTEKIEEKPEGIIPETTIPTIPSATETAETPAKETPIPTETTAPTEEVPPATETPTTQTTAETSTETTETTSITGGVIKENSKLDYVEGGCFKNAPFIYELAGNKTAEIKKNSVEVREEDENNKTRYKKLQDETVTLQISGNKAEVTTDYSVTKQGFGAEFLQDEKDYVEIDLGKLGVEAKQGTLSISLVYQDINLAEVSEEISVEHPEIQKENVTLQEENVTIINETLMNVTFVGKIPLNVTTKQYKAVINRPVKWLKTIKIENLTENLTLDLPKEAWNITIKTGKEIQDALQELELYKKIINETEKGNLITGQVTGDVSLEIKKEQGIITRFFNWLSKTKLTGKVIEEQEIKDYVTETAENKVIDLRKISEELQEKEIAIEYSTEAPVSEETSIARGKRITISAPDILNYTDILAYTSLENKISINDTEKIKLYWVKEVSENEKVTEESPVSLEKQAKETNEEIIENLSVGQLIENISKEENISKIENITEEDNVTLQNETLINETIQTREPTNETSNSRSLITGQVVLEENITEIETITITSEIQQQTTKTIREEINFSAYDLDGDGKIDYVEWNVPHLSKQTYELIIEISKAEHLDENRTFIEDIYEYVKAKDDNWTIIPAGHYVRATFEKPLDRTKDITIYARMSNCSENSVNNSIIVNGTEIPCDVYQKKKRLDEIKRVLENE